MNDYESRRRQWLARLRESGEYRRMSPRQRQILEAGSLDVLRTTQLIGLRRLERVCRKVAAVVFVSILAAATSWILDTLLLHVGLWERPGQMLACLVSTVLGFAGLLVAARRFASRRRVYLALPRMSWGSSGVAHPSSSC